MNDASLQQQPYDVLESAAQPSPDTIATAILCDTAVVEQQAVEARTTDSIGSHLGYGLAGLVVVVLPPFIPGVTWRGLVIVYMTVVACIYSVVCLIGITKGLRRAKKYRRRPR